MTATTHATAAPPIPAVPVAGPWSDAAPGTEPKYGVARPNARPPLVA
jgi:hypothetical protein